jgi:hypothetical protein
VAAQYSSTHRTNSMSDIATQAGGTAYILIYTAAAANCAAAASGTLLVSLPCSATVGTASAGVFTFNAITAANAVASGTAVQWRLCTTSAGTTCVAQGTVGTSGADLNFASGVAWTSGMNISIPSWTITATGA